MKFDTVILAAGKSSRMGSDKALMEIGGEVCIEIHLKKILPISEKLIVVTGNNHDLIREVLGVRDKVIVAYNEQHERGMFSSVQEGFRHVSGKNPILLQMVDQPGVSVDVYERLLDAWRFDCLIMQPGVQIDGELLPGHPLVFHPHMGQRILDMDPSSILREMVQNTNVVKVEDQSVLENLNTPTLLAAFQS